MAFQVNPLTSEHSQGCHGAELRGPLRQIRQCDGYPPPESWASRKGHRPLCLQAEQQTRGTAGVRPRKKGLGHNTSIYHPLRLAPSRPSLTAVPEQARA